MIFLTYWFVVFAIVALPAYWFVPHPGLRKLILLGSCAVFHTHFAGPAGVLPIVVLGVATYCAGRLRYRPACIAAIVLCVASLVFYKYTTFICRQILGAISPELQTESIALTSPWLPSVPPLAISFFVFEFVHYLVDVYRGRPSIWNVLDFSLFSIFWPSIVAGPVKRYESFLPSLESGLHSVGERDVAAGTVRVAVGFVKKLIADNLTAYIAFYGPQFATFPLRERWFLVLLISLRILLDFSGYSDIAIGFGRMYGIRLPENFNWPYLAVNLQDFWRCWHISLSSWIRDYIYIALGGNRVGPIRRIANGLLAFGICGLWHGAGWNFLVWGLLHGAGLAISTNYRTWLGPVGAKFGNWLDAAPPVCWLLTMAFVFITWLFFFYPVADAWKMIEQLFDRHRAFPH